MKTYTIYHIQGHKIGCSSEPEKRVQDQGFTDFEVLEVHTDIHEASDREIELQEEYGYPIDTIPYWMSVQNRPVWKGNSLTEEDRIRGGQASGRQNVETGHLAIVRDPHRAARISAQSEKASHRIIRTCECGRTFKGPSYGSHRKVCKKKGLLD